jgi:hypothetical protein
MAGPRRAFSSKISFQDAANQARAAGYGTIVGQMQNSHRQFVVFARATQQGVQQRRTGWL